MQLSVKAQRALQHLGVWAALQRGEQLVLAGPVFELRKQPGIHARLAFVRDEQQRLCVGTATDAGGSWHLDDSEPFSLRALGYQQRHLKRIGDWIGDGPRARR